MNNEFVEIMKNILFTQDKEATEELDLMIKDAYKEKVKISLSKDKTGDINIKKEGTGIAILIAMAGLEKAILTDTKCPNFIWEYIKRRVGVKKSE